MPIPPPIFPAKPRRHHKTRLSAARGPGALVLVSAVYVPSTSLELTFGRAIDIGGLVENQILINDGPTGLQFQDIPPPTLTGPAKVRFDVLDVQPWTSADVRLNASALTGIVAAGDGAAWAGVTDLLLPFGV